MKIAEDGKLKRACEDALEQIRKKRYGEEFSDGGTVLKYGIGCYEKMCLVVFEE